MSDTPETDASDFLVNDLGMMVVESRVARRLEQERDAARKELAEILETYRNIIVEPCRNDERHCTCVPALREEIRKLRESKWEAVHSGGYWWIADAKTGDLIEMIAGLEKELAENIAKHHNATLNR